jgi:hydrogenase nickel incorporation protein HypA/HybF
MHELPVMKSVLDICLRHAARNNAKKIISVKLKVGELSDLQDNWMQRYFDHLSKGTPAEEARLLIERMPLIMHCSLCSDSFPVNLREDEDIRCPRCGSEELTYVSGREYRVESMEVV